MEGTAQDWTAVGSHSVCLLFSALGILTLLLGSVFDKSHCLPVVLGALPFLRWLLKSASLVSGVIRGTSQCALKWSSNNMALWMPSDGSDSGEALSSLLGSVQVVHNDLQLNFNLTWFCV